jgi:EmrB/QacA subfamily drug resistance transporter
LHATTGDLQWIVDAYTLVLAAALLPGGMLGDQYGRKKFLLIALVVFGVSSAACAYASSPGMLIATRVALGLGAAVIMPLSMSVLPVMFTAEERPKAIGIISAAIFLSFPIGPIVGGWLLTHYWWGSVFLLNVPVVVVACIAVAVLMPESRSARRSRPDLVGILISSLGLAGLTYGVIDAGQHGWGNSAALATLSAGAVAMAGFVAWQRRVTNRESGQPLVDLSLFRSASFTWGTILATVVSFAMFGILFAMPLYFQEVRGADPLGSGVRLLPLIGGMMVGMIGGTALQRRLKTPASVWGSAKAMVALGFAVLATALATGAFTTVDSGDARTAWWFAVAGLGLGLVMPATMNAALSVLSPERSGMGTALITTLRQVGGTFGVAVLGTVLNSIYRGNLEVTGLPPAVATTVRDSVVGGVTAAQRLRSAPLLDSVRTAFVHAMDVMLWVCAGVAVAAVLLTLAFLPHRAGSAEPVDGEQPAPDQQPAAIA